MGRETPRGGEDTRALLIRAGMEELNEYGAAHFSSRRVAKKCGVSSAAPYKHFKDVDAFIAAILKHIISLYSARQEKLLEDCADRDSRQMEFRLRPDMVDKANELMQEGGMLKKKIAYEDLLAR